MAFGLADAFFYPAFRTILPRLVTEDQLEAGNALIQGTAQLGALAGPALAGILIATTSTASAFAIDAVTFAFAALMLWRMRRVTPLPIAGDARSHLAIAETGSLDLLSDIRAALRYAWSDPAIRVILLIVAAVHLVFVGPFEVGAAWLANHHFGGTTALGLMLAAMGGGSLLGALLAGIMGPMRRRGVTILAIVGANGAGLTLIGIAPNAFVAAAVIGAIGIGSGIVYVVAMAWLQARTESHMLGRIMSLVMLATVGVTPFSYAAAGALADLNVTLMLGCAGAAMVIVTAIAMTSRATRAID